MWDKCPREATAGRRRTGHTVHMARSMDALDHPVTRAVTGTAVIGGVVIAVAVSLSAVLSPLPVAEVGEPVIVDEAPGLPSDEEPPGGWPAPTITDDPLTDDVTDVTDTTDTSEDVATSDDGDGGAEDPDVVDDVTDTVDDLVDDLTDTVDDLTDDVTDTVDDVVDDATDTVEDATDDVEDVLP